MPPPTVDAQLFHRSACLLGEGPFWHRNRLHWVDILNSRLHSCAANGGDGSILTFPSHVGAVAPWADGFIAGTQQGFGLLDVAGKFSLLPNSPHFPAAIRSNDGKLDPSGRFWCGTMGYASTPGVGSLFRVDQDGSVTRMLDGLTIANGLDWDERRRLFYYIDTPTHRVDVFDYDGAAGTIANRRTAFTLPTELGLPDGMARDDAGRLWIAFWGGGHVIGFDPQTGKALARIRVPTSLTSSCWVSADQHMIYITTARVTLSETELAAEPLAGSVFCAPLPAP